jgi:hypothetical protein
MGSGNRTDAEEVNLIVNEPFQRTAQALPDRNETFSRTVLRKN